MKKVWIFVVLLIILAGAAYLGRHQLKSLFMGPVQPVATTTTTVSPTAAATTSASGSNIYMTKTDTAKVAYMTDFQGMTLYTFDTDTKGVSNCNNGCAKAWPPYTSGATAQGTFPTNITVITRADGSKQFAWKGMPLYYYATDAKPGDMLGDGVNGTWHIVKL